MRLNTLRKMASFMWIPVGIAALYVGYLFFARYDENARMDRQAAEKEAERAKKDVEMLGGDSLKIMQFFASAMSVPKGGKGKLCYGVANAASVSIEPGVTERIWPALSHCVDVAPNQDTEYTLTAKDASGHSVEKKITLLVR